MKKRKPEDRRAALGEFGFQTYQQIEADARDLQDKLRHRGEGKGPGRLERRFTTLGEIQSTALDLLEQCNTYFIPPPPPLVALFQEAWARSEPSVTGQYRDSQFSAAAEAETASLRVDEQGNLLYRAKKADVAKAAGADRHTIRDWRRTKKYAQAVVEALSRQVAEHMEFESTPKRVATVKAIPPRPKASPQVVEVLYEDTDRIQPPAEPLQTDAEREEAVHWCIVQLWKSGRSLAFIADEFNMTPNEVRKALGENQLDKQVPRPRKIRRRGQKIE